MSKNNNINWLRSVNKINTLSFYGVKRDNRMTENEKERVILNNIKKCKENINKTKSLSNKELFENWIKYNTELFSCHIYNTKSHELKNLQGDLNNIKNNLKKIEPAYCFKKIEELLEKKVKMLKKW